MRFIILFGLAALTACGFVVKKDSTTSDAIENRVLDPEPLIEPSANAVVERPESLEISMPAFAPQYPGSLIKSAVNSSGGGVKTHEVRLETKDDAAKIFEFYRGRFVAAGLQKNADFQSGGTGMLSAVGRGRKASIAITKEQDQNIVIVTFSGE